MGVWLDIIGSALIGSLLLLNLMGVGSLISEQGFRNVLNYATQGDISAMTEIVEYDLVKAGFRVSGTAVDLADTGQVRFMADIDANGVIDTLHYYSGATTELAHTPNPEDRILYRVKNGDTAGAVKMYVTDFNLSYFNTNGDSLAMPVNTGDIRHIRVRFVAESQVPYDTSYEMSFVELNIHPKNL